MKRLSVILLIGVFAFIPLELQAKTFVKRGMGIGAAAGALTLGLPLGIATAVDDCDPDQSDDVYGAFTLV